MSDNQTPNSALIVILTYRVGTGLALPIALGLTGQTSYQWTVPANVESTAVTIIAVVTDTGFLTGTNTSPQFEIYKDVQEGFPLMTVLLIVIIIVVVLAVVLVLLMKRKKPKEEEEAAAPPAAEEEPPAEEEEMAEEEAPAPPPKAAPKPVAAPMAAKPPAKAPTKTKECPSCGTIVSVTDKECFMCGAKL